MDGRELHKEISKIPGDKGFWKSSTKETFEDVALVLLNQGVPAADVLLVLTKLYNAVSEEYGN